MSENNYIDKKIDKIDQTLEKLAMIQIDISKMLAVHEEKISQNEKNMNYLEDVMEKRREESDIKLKDVYDTMRVEDSKILDQLNLMRKESSEQHIKLTDRITSLEHKVFKFMGAISVIMFIIMYGPNILKLFIK